ncbi:MAG: glycosyltransferase 87 family protein [Oscillospiraceae bacterium]|nr:glycosyltransferase 87 family protein [Oscillospiraceae bacterium]
MDLQFALLILFLEAALGLFLLRRAGLLTDTVSWVAAGLLSLLAIGVRAAVFSYETLDYINFLSRWVEFFRQYGNFRALRYSVGNYNIPYLYYLALCSVLPFSDLYLIKLLSTLSDFLLAWAVMLICSRFTKNRVRLLAAYFTCLFLPTVFLNSAVWGQCDSLYAAPLLLGIWCAMDDRPWTSVILGAVAFGFKLQAVFVLPIYAVFLMNGKLKWKHLLAFPVTYVLLVLPAVCFGRPFWETVTLYFSQTGTIGSGLNYNSPSVFAVFTDIADEDKPRAAVVAIVLAFFYMFNLLAVAWVNRRKLGDKAILALALLFAIGIPFLLPHMHERYFFCADILSLILAFSLPLFSPAAVLVQFASLLGYHAYLRMRYLLLMNYGSAALIVAFAIALVCLLLAFQEADRKNKKRKKHS